MGIYSQNEYNEGVVTGFADEVGLAWHQYGISVDEAVAAGRAFRGPVPAEVADRILCWKPVVVDQQDKGMVVIMDDEGNSYQLPPRLGQVICNPNTKRVVNVAGTGYNADLHITLRQALDAATDAEAEIASVVCLGDGAHMGMSLRPKDTLVLGGEWGGVTPYLGLGSSLTGALATQLDTGVVERVCDNTCHAAENRAQRRLRAKRTRRSDGKITASMIREALEISFADAQVFVTQMETMANFDLTDATLAQILEAWKPIPEDEGRGQTIAKRQHDELIGELHGPRNPFGFTVAGIYQAHNTWAHWVQGMRGADGAQSSGDVRLARKAQRTMEGHVAASDAEFLAIIDQAFPGVMDVLAAVGG